MFFETQNWATPYGGRLFPWGTKRNIAWGLGTSKIDMIRNPFPTYRGYLKLCLTGRDPSCSCFLGKTKHMFFQNDQSTDFFWYSQASFSIFGHLFKHVFGSPNGRFLFFAKEVYQLSRRKKNKQNLRSFHLLFFVFFGGGGKAGSLEGCHPPIFCWAPGGREVGWLP